MFRKENVSNGGFSYKEGRCSRERFYKNFPSAQTNRLNTFILRLPSVKKKKKKTCFVYFKHQCSLKIEACSNKKEIYTLSFGSKS